MRKIKVHNPINNHIRYYNLFWNDLTDELKNRYEVIENRQYYYTNFRRFEANLKYQLSPKLSPKGGISLLDSDYIIEFMDDGDFYVLSASDDLTSAILNEKDNSHLKKVLISQFREDKLNPYLNDANKGKYSPWIYFPRTIDDLTVFNKKRNEIPEYIDKMYFRGTSIQDRVILSNINSEYLEGVTPIGGPLIYFEDLIKYKIGLSVAGVAELCYRDIEYMALGVPFIRFEYITKLNPNLIPNFHYISVERPDELIIDRLGDENHSKMIEKRFLEVKDDKDFLNFITKNAKEYYDTYLTRYNNVKHTLNLLGL